MCTPTTLKDDHENIKTLIWILELFYQNKMLQPKNNHTSSGCLNNLKLYVQSIQNNDVNMSFQKTIPYKMCTKKVIMSLNKFHKKGYMC
jgi:hypothetical protein